MSSEWLGLEGKIAVVTGAAGGMGRAIATSFVEAGCAVALLDRDIDALKSLERQLLDAGGRVTAIICDTGSEGSIADAALGSADRLGPADILVNAAGILRPGSLANLPLEEWNTLLNVNLTGCLLCAQAFRHQMIGHGGSMVHIASIAASNPQPRSGAYSASKAAVAMLSRQLALEWGPDGIRSNVVSPGLIRTPMSEAFYQQPEVKERREQMLPSRRIGMPQDIADAVLFLASPRSSYVNGAELLVDGGLDQVIMEVTPRPGY
jgi:NAD(P)-dependent dehydrogenase (short-subunit alcohol dehydrogenase family)